MGLSMSSCSCKPNICGSILLFKKDSSTIDPDEKQEKKFNNELKKTIVLSLNEIREDIYICQPQDEINNTNNNIFINFSNGQN